MTDRSRWSFAGPQIASHAAALEPLVPDRARSGMIGFVNPSVR